MTTGIHISRDAYRLGRTWAVWLGVLGGIAVCQPALAQEDAPRPRTEQLVAAFKQVRSAPEGGRLTAEDRKANEPVFEKLDAFFDYEAFTEAAIAPHRDKLAKPQLERYKKAFRTVIRKVAYPDSGAFLRDARLKYSDARLQAETRADVDMDAYVPKDDIDTKVTFHWQQKQGVWRIVDVSFDGDSLVKDYRNQFGRILDKDGAEGLLKRLADKEREVETGKAGKK